LPNISYTTIFFTLLPFISTCSTNVNIIISWCILFSTKCINMPFLSMNSLFMLTIILFCQ
jgi:hypothetical protein